MGQHIAIKKKLAGAVAVGALTVGAFAAAGVGSAPTANATCASLLGIGNNSMQCTSNLTSVAIAIGTNAEDHANGLFGADRGT